MSGNKVLQVPYGTKDLLPGEAGAKRKMEDRLAANFTQWGYAEVQTPTFEYLDTFALGGSGITEESMKFLDRNNKTLVLRSDMTTPLARMVATRMGDEETIKRLFYVANIFRYEQTQAGRQCEFSQAGVELMGTANPMADAEVLALAVASLQTAGLVKFKISVGHIGFLAGIMEEVNLTGQEKEKIKQLVLEHNAVDLENYVNTLAIDENLKEILGKLLFLQDGPDMLKKLQKSINNEKSSKALENLLQIYTFAKAYGVAKFLSFDLSLIRNFDYYTGMVFEAYTPDMGFNICGGGRYDTMMSSFGKDSPATGFALGIDRIILALQREENFSSKANWDVFVAWEEGYAQAAIKKVTELRKQGKKVKIAFYSMDENQAEQAAVETNCASLIYIR
jgi:ATP phosphoribosyltransferase regulatory subunit